MAFTRVGDYYNLSGAIAVTSQDGFVVSGVKRPQSLQEQRSPQDAVFLQAQATPSGSAQHLITRFPTTPGGTRLTSHFTLGGDGVLYLVRHQRVLMESGLAQERSVLWAAQLGLPSGLGAAASVIDFRIPFIHQMRNPMGSVHQALLGGHRVCWPS